ncbi:hypothetical protein AVEN_52316-1 [Araneus ventricosus]|uniref:Uncharacterized protein n=1 Tax=Araneus ventricosus TaxID=182803 RepID=A0A4Y2GIW3_ARAVE|nr:hypothetical protein AVEN_52316-1 [Araneus ventricosus]
MRQQRFKSPPERHPTPVHWNEVYLELPSTPRLPDPSLWTALHPPDDFRNNMFGYAKAPGIRAPGPVLSSEVDDPSVNKKYSPETLAYYKKFHFSNLLIEVLILIDFMKLIHGVRSLNMEPGDMGNVSVL